MPCTVNLLGLTQRALAGVLKITLLIKSPFVPDDYKLLWKKRLSMSALQNS